MDKAFVVALCFYFFSAAGWFFESVYCSVPERRWVNRGFLFGPICPIYGTGAVLFLLTIVPLGAHLEDVGVGGFAKWTAIVLAGMLLADTLEYLTSVVMERMFHARWWDYSDEPFNLNGRICLKHTVYWGIAAAAFTGVIEPIFVGRIVALLPVKAVYAIVTLSTVILIADVINAVRNAADIKKLMDKLQQFTESISAFSLTGTIKENVEELQNTLARSREKLTQRYAEAAAQMNELKSTFESAAKSGKRDKKESKRGTGAFANRIMRGYPNLRVGAKSKLSSVEGLLHELKVRIMDEDEEMY